MKRYIFYDTAAVEDVNGKWVRYSDIVNDPGHIPSMQIIELARRLESLETSIEKGQIESNKKVWLWMSGQCRWNNMDCKCFFNNQDSMNNECSYNNCPILKGINS